MMLLHLVYNTNKELAGVWGPATVPSPLDPRCSGGPGGRANDSAILTSVRNSFCDNEALRKSLIAIVISYHIRTIRRY